MDNNNKVHNLMSFGRKSLLETNLVHVLRQPCDFPRCNPREQLLVYK
jgi:hypothetical protein